MRSSIGMNRFRAPDIVRGGLAVRAGGGVRDLGTGGKQTEVA